MPFLEVSNETRFLSTFWSYRSRTIIVFTNKLFIALLRHSRLADASMHQPMRAPATCTRCIAQRNKIYRDVAVKQWFWQPRGETVTKTLVKFVLSFQNFGKKIACAVGQNRIQPLLQYGCVALRMRFFSPKFWNDKTNFTRVFVTV